jgi:hypothetical protein
MIRNRIAGTVLVSLMTALVGTLFVQPAQASTGYYEISNLGSGKCAEVDRFGAPYSNGGLVVQRTCDRNDVQLWSPGGAGPYMFVNRASGLCMDVRNGINADATPVQQWACTGTTSMKWNISPNSFTGVHQITSQIGGRCLDVRSGSGADGAQIQIYHCTGFGNSAQVWSFVPA